MGKLGGYREHGTKEVIDIRNEASLQDRCVLGEMDKMFFAGWSPTLSTRIHDNGDWPSTGLSPEQSNSASAIDVTGTAHYNM